MSSLLRTLSPQVSAVYKQLSQDQILSAQEIADNLGILPNAVYRVANKLIDLGMIEKTGSYPTRYKALPTHAAMSFYIQAVAQSLRRELLYTRPQPLVSSSPLITLIKNRSDAMRRSNSDARAAQESIDFIVSGLEVPDDTVLAFRKAAAIGVPIRTIVQNKQENSKERLEKWQKIGAQVRYLPDINMRLFVFDRRITYLLSYDAARKDSAFGVRFDYGPLAVQMSELFEQNWQKAEPLKSGSSY